MYKFLTPLRARKAKFGFKLDYVGINSFKQLGRLMEFLELQNTDYIAEMVGMHQTDFRLYTDDDALAETIHKEWCIENV